MRHTRPPVALSALLCCAPLFAGDPAPRERQTDPWRPPADLGTTPAGHVQVAGFASVQVNVNAQHQNVLNDAGNEPSIEVDPTAPLRMAIGWRQFDNIASNFRQAGWS